MSFVIRMLACPSTSETTSSGTRAAYWLVGLGVIGAVLAAVFGVLDLLAIPRRAVAFDTGLVHMSLNLAVLAAFVASLFLRWGLSYADATATGLIVLSAAALVALGVSGWLGATLVYCYGVRVADERTQAEGFAASVQGPRGDGTRHRRTRQPDPDRTTTSTSVHIAAVDRHLRLRRGAAPLTRPCAGHDSVTDHCVSLGGSHDAARPLSTVGSQAVSEQHGSDIAWLLERYRSGTLTLAEVADGLARARAEAAEWRARAEERERLLEERQCVVEALRRSVRALEAAARLADWQAQAPERRVIEVDESMATPRPRATRRTGV